MSLTITIPGAVDVTTGSTAPAVLTIGVGVPGAAGPQGPAGPGVPVGGTAGQYLQKIDGTNYNTDWVTLNLSAYAPLASPAFTGDPTAPTAVLGDNDTSLATTAFVQQELASGVAVAKNLEVYVRNQTGSTIPAGSIVYISGATGNRPLISLAQANNDANSAQTMGFTKESIANNGFGYVIVRGELENIDTSALTEGVQLYLSPTTAGTWTTTKPSAPQHLVYVGIVVRAHPTQGIILVAVQNGYELNELHDVKITSASNGQVLKYDSAQGLWVNGTDVGGVAWGGITGTLSSQTDLQNALDLKANLASPTFTGTPTLPTGTIGVTQTALDSTTALATTAFVTTADNLKADLASPALTGNVTITSNSATAALTITQDGAGDILRLNDVAGDTTFTFVDALGKVNTVATTTASAGLNVAHGTAPTTPVNGDIWTTTTGLFSRINGSTQQYPTLSANNTFSNASGTFGSSTAAGTINVASGATISASTKTVNVGTGGVVGSTTNITVGPVLGASTTTIGATTAASTLNLATGATLTATTKAVNIGTSGVAGSTTNITIGSTTGTSTTTLQGITNGVTQTAGDSSLKLATTAFVTAAVPAFATASQALALTSNTVSISPLTLQRVIMHPSFRRITSMANNAVSTTSGTGSSNYVSSNWIENIGPSSGTTGSAMVTPANVAGFDLIGRLSEANIDFSKRIILCGKFGQAAASGYLGDANNFWMFSLGKASAYAGNFTGRAIGIRKFGSTANFFLVVHDGTTLTAVDSGVGNNSFSATTDFTIVSDGAGNVTLFIDDNQVATTSAGPTGTATNGSRIYVEVNQVGTFGARIGAHTGNIGIYVAP